MRLRVPVDSLERPRQGGTRGRFSVATEKLGPIIAMVLLIPSSIVLFVLGITTGFFLATGVSIISLLVVPYFLLLIFVLTLVGPMVLPTRDGGAIVRLLLLPIPRFDLYVAQLAGA